MYKYEYKTIESSFSGWLPFAGNIYDTDNYRDLINKRAWVDGGSSASCRLLKEAPVI